MLNSSGVTDPSLRQAVEARAAQLGGGAAARAALPAGLSTLVDKVALRAFEVTDDDLAGLRRAGYSEDAIFEIVVSAELGAGLGRLARGLTALKDGR